MTEPYGAFALVLHSHLPHVLSHDRLEEEWLLEAVVESYLPLLHLLQRLILQGISPKVTLGLTPVLLEQLADSRFADKLRAYVEYKAHAAQEDHRAFQRREEHLLARLADLWTVLYRRVALFFTDELASDLIGAIRRLQKKGHVEVLASAATHAYLPLLGFDESVRAQIEIGTRSYQRHFGVRPQGFWLPECAYRPASRWTPPLEGIERLRPTERRALDEILAATGIRYFFVDARQLHGSPPDYGRHSPTRVYWVDGGGPPPSPPVAVFSRDFDTTSRVWQHDSGYPGDPWYLEFHKKQAGGGLRYWRITDRRADLAHKQLYIPESAFAQVSTHARHFVEMLRRTLRAHWQRTREQGIIVAAFDTELFGHWWFEGPQWVYEVLRQLALDGDVALTTCSEYLLHHPPQRTVRLAESSWGAGGDHRVWLQDHTRWLWRDLYHAECDLQNLGARLDGKKLDRRLTRLLQQCGREMLLLQASDWPFMISTDSTPDHAERRFSLHYNNFQHLRMLIERYLAGESLAEEDWRRLEELERENALFPTLDPNVFWQGKYHVDAEMHQCHERTDASPPRSSPRSDPSAGMQPTRRRHSGGRG
jgi:1,4-alpha-glucan branching enzyme